MSAQQSSDKTLPPIIAEYAKTGLPMFPIIADGKVPIVADWQGKATCDTDQLAKWRSQYPGCNFGIHLGGAQYPTCVVDCDGDAGIANAKEIIGKEMNSTLLVRTPGGGMHAYFVGVVGNTVSKVAAKVDTRGPGGYVLAPGSSIDGKPYEVVNEVMDLAAVPQIISDRAAKRPKSVAPEHGDIDLDGAVNLKLAGRYLTHAAPCAVQGDGGDSQTFIVACHVRDYGVSQDRCLDLMLAHWNDEKADPPWEPEELAKKVANAYRFAGNEKPGTMDPAQIFDTVEEDPLAPKPKVRQQTAMEFLAMGPPPARRWLIDGWIPGETSTHTYFTGKGGVGKSLMALQMGIAIGGGSRELWGADIMEHRPVLALMCEDAVIDIRHRLWAMAKHPEFPQQQAIGRSNFRLISRTEDISNHLVVQEGPLLLKGPLWSQLLFELAHMGEGPKFCILDTVSDVFGADLNDGQLVQQFLKAKLNAIGSMTNTTFMLIGHPAKATGSQFGGSVMWENGVRNRLFAEPKDPDNLVNDSVLLHRAKSNWAGVGQPMELKYNQGLYTVVDLVKQSDMARAAVLWKITQAAEGGLQLTLTNNGKASGRFIGSAQIKCRESGDLLTQHEIVTAVEELIKAGRVELVVGDKKGRNGLWPIAPDDVFDNETEEL